MKKWMVQSLCAALLACLLPFLAQGDVETAVALQEPVNLLQNPGFEGEYFPWSGINEVRVAHGWTPWWRQRTDADPPATYFKPEYKQANGYIFPNRVHGGAAAQQWFTFFATHQAGMYQQVFGVTPGTRYRFTVWAQVWSSTEDDASVSVNPAYPNLQVGIDPTGNWNPWDSRVVWSGTVAFYDKWGQLAVEAEAVNDVITVFMRSEPNFAVKHNDMYWDDAVLVALGEGGAPVPPTATSPLPSQPTATSAAPPAPTATCAPAPADWVTYHVQRGDTLYALAERGGTTLERVISVNCLGTTTIYVGQALLLPQLPVTATPVEATAAPTVATAMVTDLPTETPTVARSATPTEPPATFTATAIPPSPTATPAAVAVATVTATPREPTTPPLPTPTPPARVPPTSSTPAGDSARPCGTIAVGAGIVLLVGILVFRRRRKTG